MGVATNASGWMRMEGLFFGVVWTFLLFVVGIVLVIVGSSNTNNKLDPAYEFVHLRKVASDRYCASGASDIMCRRRDKRYKSTYSTDECSNYTSMTPYTEVSNNPGPSSVRVERHKATRECRASKMDDTTAYLVIFFGILCLLASMGVGLCTYNENCRGYLGIWSMFSWMTPNYNE